MGSYEAPLGFFKIFELRISYFLRSLHELDVLDKMFKSLIPRALFLGEMRIISPVSFELRPLLE
jgi:hypothetical protein